MTKKINVKHCARCGEDHEDLEFNEFSLNPIVDCNDIAWNYWSMCPKTKEPVLLRIIIVAEKTKE